MKILYFDCFSGISGDMTLAALLDLGIKPEQLLQELEKLKLDGYELKIGRAVKNGITGTDVDVVLTNLHHKEEQHQHHDHEHNHNHEHEHDHNHEHEHDHNHAHNQDHGHDHGHAHDHDQTHAQEHHHRSYQDIKRMIEDSSLKSEVKEMAVDIFTKLARAEGKIHGVPWQEVHFHEVGAVDSIIDIVGAAILIDLLQVDKLMASPLPLGSGMVRCQHGLIPVPAPATLELLKGMPVYAKNIKGEMVTPTGAAILSTLCSDFGEYPAMTVEGIGYGMGKKDFEIPNCLRVCIGEYSKK